MTFSLAPRGKPSLRQALLGRSTTLLDSLSATRRLVDQDRGSSTTGVGRIMGCTVMLHSSGWRRRSQDDRVRVAERLGDPNIRPEEFERIRALAVRHSGRAVGSRRVAVGRAG